MITENDDIKIGILIYAVERDSAGNIISKTTIPISSIHDYEVYVYTNCSGVLKLLATYKKSNTGDYAIGVPGSPNNKITIVINRRLTASAGPVEFHIETKLQFVEGADFIDGKANRSYQTNVVKINKSANKNSLR